MERETIRTGLIDFDDRAIDPCDCRSSCLGDYLFSLRGVRDTLRGPSETGLKVSRSVRWAAKGVSFPATRAGNSTNSSVFSVHLVILIVCGSVLSSWMSATLDSPQTKDRLTSRRKALKP